MRYTKHLRMLELSVFSLAIAFVLASSAEAYIDPGAGSLMWQMVIAAALTAGFLARRYWTKLKSLVGRHADADGDHNHDAPTE